MTRGLALHARFSGVAAALLLLVRVPDAMAQVSYDLTLASGTPVRITTTVDPGRRIRSEALAVRGDTLYLRFAGPGGRQAYPLNTLRSLEVRGGLDRKRGMLIGAAAGAALGLGLGGEERGSTTTGMALIGTAFGFGFAPHGWQRLPLPEACVSTATLRCTRQ